MDRRRHKVHPEAVSIAPSAASPLGRDVSEGQHNLAAHLAKQELPKSVGGLQFHTPLVGVIVQSSQGTHHDPTPIVQGRSEVEAVPDSEAQGARSTGGLQVRPSHGEGETNLKQAATDASQLPHYLGVIREHVGRAHQTRGFNRGVRVFTQDHFLAKTYTHSNVRRAHAREARTSGLR